jgi:type 1 glutamine amidotransferase
MSWRFFSAVALGLWLAAPVTAAAPQKLLLVGSGPDGHPPQTHEYMAGLKILERILQRVPGVEVKVVRADGPWREGPELLGKADGAVLFLTEGARWMRQDPRRLEAFQKLAARGGGLAALHWAIGTKDAANIEDFVKLLGGCHGGPDRTYKVLATEAQVAGPAHPVTSGIKNFQVRDEFYYSLKFVKPADGLRPVLRVPIDGQVWDVAWVWQRPDGGRSFGFSGLHFHENWQLPEYRRLVAQGVVWTLRLPVPPEGLNVNVAAKDLELKKTSVAP